MWEGALCDEREVLLVIKTATETVDALSKRLAELHPYDLPEILALDVDEDHSDTRYVAWVRQLTHSEAPGA